MPEPNRNRVKLRMACCMVLMALVTIIAGLNQNSAADTLIGAVAGALVVLMAVIYVR